MKRSADTAAIGPHPDLSHIQIGCPHLHLAELLIADNAVHPIHLKQKSKKSRKKKITTAIYEYQVDLDGEWGELVLDFETRTAEIVKLADWDTIKSNKYAKAAISYLLHCKNEDLPKDTIIPFEP